MWERKKNLKFDDYKLFFESFTIIKKYLYNFDL